MKKCILSLFTLALLSASGLLAQDLVGNWQGTLQAGGRPLRVIFKITKDDALKGVMYSIDQGAQGFGASAVTLQGTTVKISMPALNGGFEGKLGPDGKTIAGTWTQGPGNMELILTRATPETAWAIPEPPPVLKPMAADANAVFEVATIKPSPPDTQGRGIMVRGRQFSTRNTSLISLLTFAYGVHPKQLVGLPPWAEDDKYDIAAQPEAPGAPSDKQWKAMLQKLITERFKLKIHRDMKELSVYTISVEKTGTKLTKSEGDPNGLPGLFFRGLGNLPARNATMADFAGLLQSAVMDRPVVDQTGLSGRFDFTLLWTPDEFQFTSFGPNRPPQPANDNPPPDIYTAMREQLGLKLAATKAPADVIVIDSVEKPSAN